MKKPLLVLLAMVLVVSLAAFTACAKEEEVPPEEEGVWQWPEKLLTTCMSTRSPLYGALVAWTTPLSEDTGMTMRVITESDARLQTLWLKEGRFFCKAPHQNRAMFYGQKGFTRRDWGPFHSRIWMPAGEVYWSGTVLGDSDIKTPYDIKPGMKIIRITIAEAPVQMLVAVLAWGQVNPEDVVWVPCGSTAQAARFLMDGKVDVSLGYHTTPTWYEVEASPHGLRWIPLPFEEDPEGAERFLKYYPWTGSGVASGGVPASEGVPMARNISPYITAADTDPELVYRIVKWLDENYDRYKEGNPWCEAMTMENLVTLAETHYEPIHEGTVRYLEEIGLWTDELEARRQYNIELMDKWVVAYQTAIDMADDREIVVDPDNEQWQKLWEDYRDSLNLPLLVNYQEPGKEQLTYPEFYQEWNRVKAITEE